MNVTRLPLLKKIALNLFSHYKQNETRLHQLNYIMWECTLRCNLHCLHCGSDCTKDASVPDMPVRDFIRAIDEVHEIVTPEETMIVFTGGEPLMRKDLEEAGIELYKRRFPWGVVTNGLLLSPKRLESLLNAGMRAVTISLDGLKVSHNWLRGNVQSYRMAMEAIRLLPGIPDLKFDVVTCVNQKNISELPELKKILIDAGVSEWRVFTIFPVGRAKYYERLHLPSDGFKALFEFISDTRKEGKIKLSYGCEGFLGAYERIVRDEFFFCRAGINVASVLVDGSISACPSLRSNFIQGNIYKDNFADVWQHRYQVFRDRNWTKTGICASCDFYRYCEGNGMHLRDENTGELLFCHLHRIREAEAPALPSHS